jgi:acyl-CoA synthetase (NDP forming)
VSATSPLSPEGARDDLRGLFDPASVAVIGATDNPKKWGYQYSSRLLAAEGRRRVHLVNQNQGLVRGRRAFRSLVELPEVPEVAVICVPRDAVLGAVESAAALGVRYAICITAGFAETGGEGRALQERIVDAAKQGGMRLVGPNCLGVIDTAAQFDCSAFWDVPAGTTGLICQSGTVLLELGIKFGEIGLGVSRGVSVGNQADLAIHEYIEAFVANSSTRILVAYVEEFRDGRALLAAAERFGASGRPFVLLSPFGSEAVRRAASSHTGSLVSSDAIVDAACADLGIIRVTSIADLLLTLKGLSAPRRSRGSRVAILSDGGGAATLSAGVAGQEGLAVPAFSEALKANLAAVASAGSGISNPVDFVGALDIEVFIPVVEAVAATEEIDAVIMAGFFNNVRPPVDLAREQAFARRIIEAAAARAKALAIATPLPAEPAMQAMAAAGVPVFGQANEAVRCLLLSSERIARRVLPGQMPQDAPIAAAPDYHTARELLAAAGVRFAPARRVSSRAEALAAAGEIGFPVVLKGLGSSHKSDSGAVILDLRDGATLSRAFDEMRERLAPPGFSVEAMIEGRGAVEILVGGLRDRGFGASVAVGLGGTLAEILKDTVVALAPVAPAYAREMLLRLKGAALLRGYRGRPPVDLDALAEMVAGFSRFMAAHPEVTEAELNPVIVLPSDAIAVDARIALG